MAVRADLPDQILAKVERVKTILQEFDSVAIAFSGGVDSTVLLHICSNHLTQDSVTAYFVNSCLQSAASKENVENLIARHFSDSSGFVIVELNPLLLNEVVINNEQRCYYCKKSSYTTILEMINARGQQVLFDGTNTDDLREDRPGLKAVKELGVRSPLLEAGFSKTDIREYARSMGLENHNLPSNSCLATRVDTGTPIALEALYQIEQAELFLFTLGFRGSRVRLRRYGVCIELQEKDISTAATMDIRLQIIEYFESASLGPVYIGLSGR